MKNVTKILESLECTQGSNAKLEILVKNRENKLLMRVFSAAQDPYVVYYVNRFKMPPPVLVEDSDEFIDGFLNFIFETLSTRTITGNDAKDCVVSWFSKMNELQQKWCQRILLKNLRLGVQESTLTKVWPGLVKSFTVQLANSFPSSHSPDTGIVLEKKVQYPVRVEPKIDGLRCVVMKESGKVTMLTRNGTELDTLPTIKAALASANYDNVVLDGECMGKDWSESASVVMSRKTLKDDSGIVFNVFDAVPIEDWKAHIVNKNLPYTARIEMVRNIVDVISSDYVRQVLGEIVNNDEELLLFYSKQMENGYEGIMLKDVRASYVFKRSDAILKLKPVATFEGVIVGWYEGRRGTKREGQFGGFNIVLQNGVMTRLGGGFSDQLRAEITLEEPDNFVGRVVEVEGQPEPMTKDGLTSDGRVRFPVFIRFRDFADVDPAILTAAHTYISQNGGSNE